MSISSIDMQDCIDSFHRAGLDEWEEFDYQLEATHIVDLLKQRISRKQYKPITSIHFSCSGKIYELDRLIYRDTDWGPHPMDFSDYDSIVEVLGTASAFGCYIDGYIADRGELLISFKQDFNIDNITPELIEFISITISKNRFDDLFGDLLGMP